MSYQVENIYTEETRGFNVKESAIKYILDEVERLNKRDGNVWTTEDFSLYEFIPEDWKYREISIN